MNLSKYIDKDPPLQNDGKSLIDYLAYLKEQINFLFHNWSRSIKESSDTAAEVKNQMDAMTETGTIKSLSSGSVIFSNNLIVARGRASSASLDSTSGTQIGTSGIYRYTISLHSSAASGMSLVDARPVEVCSVYSNSLGISIPAAMRAEGSSGAWTTHKVTFQYPAATLSGTFAVDYLFSGTM